MEKWDPLIKKFIKNFKTVTAEHYTKHGGPSECGPVSSA